MLEPVGCIQVLTRSAFFELSPTIFELALSRVVYDLFAVTDWSPAKASVLAILLQCVIRCWPLADATVSERRGSFWVKSGHLHLEVSR